MLYFRIFLLTFLFAIFQVSVFVPVFKSLVFSPYVSILFLWIYGKNLEDKKLITTSFFLGIFLDGISNTWGAYTFSTVLLTSIYTSLRNILIFKKESYEIFFIVPTLLILYKLLLLFLLNLKTEVDLSVKKFLISFSVELLFTLFFYKLRNKTDEET